MLTTAPEPEGEPGDYSPKTGPTLIAASVESKPTMAGLPAAFSCPGLRRRGPMCML